MKIYFPSTWRPGLRSCLVQVHFIEFEYRIVEIQLVNVCLDCIRVVDAMVAKVRKVYV